VRARELHLCKLLECRVIHVLKSWVWGDVVGLRERPSSSLGNSFHCVAGDGDLGRVREGGAWLVRWVMGELRGMDALGAWSTSPFKERGRRVWGEVSVDSPEGTAVILVRWPVACDAWLELDGIVSGVGSRGGEGGIPVVQL